MKEVATTATQSRENPVPRNRTERQEVIDGPLTRVAEIVIRNVPEPTFLKRLARTGNTVTVPNTTWKVSVVPDRHNDPTSPLWTRLEGTDKQGRKQTLAVATDPKFKAVIAVGAQFEGSPGIAIAIDPVSYDELLEEIRGVEMVRVNRSFSHTRSVERTAQNLRIPARRVQRHLRRYQEVHSR